MHPKISRREFGKRLAALASGTALLGHQPGCTSMRRASPTPEELRSEFKDLRGTLLIDEPARQAAGSDFGLIVHRPPIAVLKPGVPQDILKMVEFANQRGVQVAMRGQGHAMFGQAQVEKGVVIDSSTLNAVRMVNFRGAPAVEAEAGALWDQVLDLAYAQQLTPRVNVDPGYLSVGGTLSTGGFGDTSWREGFQTDHVHELQVVTGQGRLVTCSDNHPIRAGARSGWNAGHDSRDSVFTARLDSVLRAGLAIVPRREGPVRSKQRIDARSRNFPSILKREIDV